MMIRCILVVIMVTLLGQGIAAAQDPDPAAVIEARAQQVHLQNLRTESYTFWLGGDLGNPPAMRYATLVGERLTGWELRGLGDTPDTTSDDLARPTLLNFWASWCTPCVLEFPHLAGVALRPDDTAFDVLFVNMSDSAPDALAFLADQPAGLRTVIDPDDRLSRRASVVSIPTSILLDTDGTVLAVHTGLLTPTVTDFLSAVAAQPGVGTFTGYDGPPPAAVLEPVAPDDAAPLQPGQQVRGTLTDDEWQHAYQFAGQAGNAVTVTMDAAPGADLDPYLVLMTAGGERLAENDDHAQSTDAQLVATLPADGTYLVVATRFLEAEGYASGEYTLALTLGDMAVTPAPPAQDDLPQPITYGEAVSGTLDDSNFEDLWAFAGQAGDVIALTMTRRVDEPGGLDGYLLLRDPADDVLLEVDDYGNDDVMPRVEQFELPTGGTYTIVATRFGFQNGISTGDYRLTLERLTAGAGDAGGDGAAGSGVRWLPDGSPPDDTRWLSYNSRGIGTLDSDNIDDWFIFNGRAGDVITVRMAADGSALDPYVILVDSGGYELQRKDDVAPGNPTAAIQDFALPADGSYLVRATRYGFAHGPSSGSYTLVLESEAASPGSSADVPPQPVTLGTVVAGVLNLDRISAAYRFDGQAGVPVTIVAERTSGDLDLALALTGPDGGDLAFRRDGFFAGEVRIPRVTLPADGAYRVEVLLEDLNTAGEYWLLVLPGEPAPAPTTTVQPQPGTAVDVVLRWEGSADLDLVVTPPDGGAAGDRTPGADFCASSAGQAQERVVWDTARAGRYAVAVRYRLDCAGTAAPVPFMLVLAQDGAITAVIEGTLARPGDRYLTRLEVVK